MIAWIRVVGSALLLTSAAAHAQACGPYKVAFYEFGSMYSKAATGLATGIDIDLIEELRRRTGCSFNGFLDARIRTWISLESGALDMTVSAIGGPDREKFAVFIPYVKVRNQLVVRASFSPSLSSVESFSTHPKLRLAVVRGFKYGTGFDAWIADLRQQGRVDEYVDAEIVARVFALGRADGLITEPMVWGPLAKKNSLDGKVEFLPGFAKDATVAGLALSRSRVKDADVLLMTKSIESMRADGTLLKIFKRHLPADVAESVLP